MKTEFKLKTPLELGAMTIEELVTYIDSLHNSLMSYQILIDLVVNKNQKITR